MSEAGVRATLLCANLRACWARGERVRVETFLEANPQLRPGPEGLLDLIYTEVVLRQEAGDAPRLDEYLARFGSLQEHLRPLFDVHDALARVPAEPPDTCRLAGSGTTGLGATAGPPDLPGYEVLGELGRGGMGVVFKARQVRPSRVVAVKMLLAGACASRTGLDRFRAEAEALARLSHPSIVPVYEVGEHAGLPFFSMEFVAGPNLAARIAGTPQPLAESARLVAALARAIHSAHQQGVVHRDLKPANVLLARRTGVPPCPSVAPSAAQDRRGRLSLDEVLPKITDFGLAKTRDGPDLQTHTGEVLGTPCYMAPEQAAGKSREVGPLADVYALGAILYECLTGRPPFQAETTTDTLLQVLHQGPVPPSRLRVKMPRDLETICLKCLEKAPARRYGSALALADDLERFLDGRPIVARPLSVSGRVLKWARRKPGLAATLAACALALAALAATAGWHIRSERDRLARARAEVSESLHKGRQAWLRGEWPAACSYLDDVLQRLDAEPALADLRPEVADLHAAARRRLAEETAQRNEREALQAFRRRQDEALFHGMNSLAGHSLLTGLSAAAHRRSAEEAARKALALAGLDGTAVRFSDEARRAEVSAGCYILLLLLADVIADDQGKKATARRHEALQLLERASRLRPPTRSYHLRRARLLRLRGDGQGADREEARARAAPLADALDHFLEGDALYRRGNVAGALRHFENAAGLQPGHFWAQCYLGACHLKFRQWHRARACLTFCLVQRPGFVWPHILRGLANQEAEAWPAAQADFRRAAALLEHEANEPARYALLVNRGTLYLKRGLPVLAADDFRAAARLRPGEYVPHVNLARACRQMNQPEEAERHWQAALRLQPPAFVAADHDAEQAAALGRQGRYGEAARLCRKALARQADHAQARGVLAHALLQQKRYDEAIRAFDRYLKDGGPLVAGVFQGRAAARLHTGDYLGACDDCTRALQIRPDAELYAQRGWGYFFADAWRPALRDFAEALRLDADLVEAHVGRGLAQVMLGRWREAVAAAEQALRLKPKAPEMMHNLACLFAQAAARVQADTAVADRLALAADYRNRSLTAIRRTLALVPSEQRPAFWRERIVPDSALAPVRNCPVFQDLQKQYSAP